jgi:hypothetical protein
MRVYLLFGLAAISLALPTPQKSLPDLGDIREIFSSSSSDNGYKNSLEPSPRTIVEPSSRSIDVLVQVLESDKLVKGEILPDDAFIEGDCSVFSSQGYSCVPYYQCTNGSIITDGTGLIDVRNGFAALDVETSKCPGFLDVCCKDPDFVPPPPPPPAPYSAQCGRRNVNGLGARIQGFKEGEAQFGEWPHMCAVLRVDTVSGQEVDLYQCGGSLVAPGVILTAAHCVERYKDQAASLKVRCGEWNTQNETEPMPHQDRDVELVKVHPEYFGGALFNDVALVFTKQEFVLSQHIDTVCLPQPGESFETESCFATGWGKDKFGSSGEYQVVLKEVDIPVVEKDYCQESLRNTRLGKRFKLDDSFLCAGGEAGKDTCRGDGGSPLVCPSKYDSSSYVQAGVVAWGIGCGEDGTPGVYADVSKAVCWMDYAVSCYYGLSTSYWGFSSDACGTWREGKVAELKKKVEDVKGRAGKIFQNQLDQYQECEVTWSSTVDVSAYGRTLENIVNLNVDSTEAPTAITELSLVEKDSTAYGITIKSGSTTSEDLYVTTEQTEVKENTTKDEVEVFPRLASLEDKDIDNENVEVTTDKNEFELDEENSSIIPSVQQEQDSLENSNEDPRK